jgi:hypothetical protein
LQSNRDQFNQPKERLWPTLEMGGPRSILSFKPNKCMRDVVVLVSYEVGRRGRQEVI